MARRQTEQEDYEAATERIPIEEIQAARSTMRQASQEEANEGRRDGLAEAGTQVPLE